MRGTLLEADAGYVLMCFSRTEENCLELHVSEGPRLKNYEEIPYSGK